MADNNKWYTGMTEDAIRQRVADTALSLKGIKEGTAEYLERIVGVYNSQGKLPRGYRLTATAPSCAATVTVIGIMLDISHIILPECSCSKMIELYEGDGRWMEADDYVPDLGDIVMYDWDAVKGECIGLPDHTGMIVGKKGNTLMVLEGNYDNQVKIREICVEYIKIRGYCLPDYGSLACGFSDVPPGSWCADEINRAAELGLMVGVGDGKFAPEKPLTRAEAAVLAVRLAELFGK